MTSSHLFLAVDGGNSKTDIVLGTTHGEVLAFVRGPGSSPHALGVPGAMRLLETLVADARLVAGVAPTARVTQAAVFMAGADLPVEIDRLSKELTALGWADRVFVELYLDRPLLGYHAVTAPLYKIVRERLGSRVGELPAVKAQPRVVWRANPAEDLLRRLLFLLKNVQPLDGGQRRQVARGHFLLLLFAAVVGNLQRVHDQREAQAL